VILEEGLNKLEADRSILVESVNQHQQTLAGVQVAFLLFVFNS